MPSTDRLNRTLWTLTFVLLFAIAILLLRDMKHEDSGTASAQNDLENIRNRKSIRAGYVSNPPSCIIDPNTKKVSGIVAEAMESAAAAANLKVEWVEEVGFGAMIEGLRANRYDIVPCAIWPTAARAMQADFTNPLFYSGVGIYVRSKETRFDNGFSKINAPDVRIATIDGEMGEAIARSDFSRARTVALPQLSEITTVLLNVKENKADVAFVETYFATKFLDANPGSLKNIAAGVPVRIFPNTILLRLNQPELKSFLNTAFDEQANLGAIDKLLDKYEPRPNTFYRIRKPYQQISK